MFSEALKKSKQKFHCKYSRFGIRNSKNWLFDDVSEIKIDKKKLSKAFSLPKMAWRDDFGSKFYSCTTKCRSENEVLVLTIVHTINFECLD